MTVEGPTPERRRQQQRIKLSASAAAFLIGFVILLVLMLPSPWAFAAGAVVGGAAAAGTYGMMYGRELSLERRTAQLSTQQESLTAQLRQIEATVRNRTHQFPPATHGQLRMMLVGLEEIVQRWETLDRAPEQQDAVFHTITNHLPRTLELFLGLPDSAKPKHAEEFKAQVGLMTEAVAKTRDQVVKKDLQALKSNRALLEEALTDPDERLFKDEGL
ncbi:hypothetical protein [Nesterenkonia alkaliphila]|uniref:5-bromo-4-chloroindolyl phosphate hydrolysis protein n=1 Tax=Nesterenkonia alkaliphila TaxID=1463631 RepID=A0A7K1UGP0_9MICC|nr:hypothetical protein [Nesterenkonia alkaliphila]MVT25582.1 hypothetical protein [Nesterenkonia alkaliphila]GFZ95136.1 hypothetical protein GCM10011359_25820 [Nesterenkonia alkaliphila]